jgi:putative tricarboxylic transport membrane protein
MKFAICTGLRLFALAALAALLAAGSVAPLRAQEKFPSKPITVVIHARYGGGTDVTARMMMIRARRELGVDMQVVSKEGGSGVQAHEFAMARPRDGYTILALTETHLYTIARGKSPLKIDDVVGVARAMVDPTFIAVSAKSRFKTLQELIDASKAAPLNWGVASIGSTEHIGLAQFAKVTGIKYKVVPFGSGGQMVQALLSGAIDATLPNVSEGKSQIEEGSFRALAVVAKKRLKDFPNIPSTYEMGIPVELQTTRGYWVLKGTPEPVVEALSKALVKSMHNEVFVNYLKSNGLTVEDSVAGHEEWDKQIKEEYAKAAESLKELGLIK